LKLLAYRAHSREELRRKLSRSAPLEEVEVTLDKLEGRGLLDDREFAYLRAKRLRTERKWGSLRIGHNLKSLGVDAKIVHFTLDRIEKEFPEEDCLREAIESWIHLSGTPKRISQLKKLFDRCLRLGHSPDQVRNELKEYFEAVDWEKSGK
jgi:SOS response regulatory protein OraA/RecX